MAVNTVTPQLNLGADTTIKPSPAIWADCPWYEILEGEVPGYAKHWSFTDAKIGLPGAQAYWANGLKAFGSATGAVTALDVLGGGITVTTTVADEGISLGQSVYPFQISRSHKKLWWEICLQTSTIADNANGWLAGLIDASTLSATVPITAAGALANQNFVGFHRLEGDGDYVNTIYKADNVTQVTVKEDAVLLVAATDKKLGMVYDPNDLSGSFYLSFYADNVRLADAKQIPVAAGTDFPNDVRLGFVFSQLAAVGATGTTSIKWARVAQVF